MRCAAAISAASSVSPRSVSSSLRRPSSMSAATRAARNRARRLVQLLEQQPEPLDLHLRFPVVVLEARRSRSDVARVAMMGSSATICFSACMRSW